MQLQIIGKRCDIKMSQCENFGSFLVRDFCKILEQKNKIWSDTVEHTVPRAKCPFKSKSIIISNATVNLAYIAYLPFISDYTWILHYKAFKPINEVRQKKRLIYCFFNEVTVTKAVKERKKP